MQLQALAYDQACRNIHGSYHPTLGKIFDSVIQPNEFVFMAAECSLSWLLPPWFVVLTSYRWIRAGLTQWTGPVLNEQVEYMKSGSRLSSWLGEGPVESRRWITPPKRLPTEKEMGKKRFAEYVGEHIHEARLQEMVDITSKREYVVTHRGNELRFIELVFGDLWVTFKSRDGEIVYSLLQLAKRNRGEIPWPATGDV